MKLIPIRHLWGVADAFDTALPRFAGLGYAGIECPLPLPSERDRFAGVARDAGLVYISMAFTGGKTVAEHLGSLLEQVKAARAMGVKQMTVHSGADWFTLAQAVEFYQHAVQLEANEGVALAHETHRGRVFFNPWRTAEVLREVPATRLCVDYSHWVVVSERLLNGCETELALSAAHALHVHTRVGYSQGPQVPDPAAPEYRSALEAHELWWRQVWSSQKARGFIQTTFTPEFGPPEYLHTLPHTNVPVADLQQVCEWMAGRVKATFGDWMTA